MRRLAVAEHQRVAFPALPAAAAQALHATRAVGVSTTPSGTRTVLQAGSTVGTVRAGTGDESVELHVRPKVGVRPHGVRATSDPRSNGSVMGSRGGAIGIGPARRRRTPPALRI